jgi:hypothetical protein
MAKLWGGSIGLITTSNSNPQCLHLNSASQTLTRATLWPQLGQAIQVFRREPGGSTNDPFAALPLPGQQMFSISNNCSSITASLLYLRTWVRVNWTVECRLHELGFHGMAVRRYRHPGRAPS